MRRIAFDAETGQSMPIAQTQITNKEVKWKWSPRIRCHDCPGKLYTPGPEQTVDSFLVHVKNRGHRFGGPTFPSTRTEMANGRIAHLAQSRDGDGDGDGAGDGGRDGGLVSRCLARCTFRLLQLLSFFFFFSFPCKNPVNW